MFIIYNLVFFIFALVYLPLYLLAGKINRGFLRRLGFLPAGLNLDRPIWIHAVSVGEVIAIRGLLSELRKLYPQKKFVISTVTATGNKIAQGLLKPGDFLTYLPLDFSFVVKKVLKKINPSIFIIAETEIWPNLITCLDRQKTPVVIINGRISDSSFGGYRAIKFFIRPILNKVSKFCVQTNVDAARLEGLGVDKQAIQVTGNIKFDLDLDSLAQIDLSVYREKLSLGQSDKLWVCGSTHPGEEELIFKAYQKLLVALPDLKLLIAPRHPERSKDIARLAERNGFTPVFISSLPDLYPARNKPVFILDLIGQLLNYYAIADIVFVAGSLVKTGGHNILEPASLKKPVIFGQHMFNFREMSRLFLENKAALMVHDARQLTSATKEILSNNLLAGDLVERAYALIIKNKGATQKNIQIIRQLSK